MNQSIPRIRTVNRLDLRGPPDARGQNGCKTPLDRAMAQQACDGADYTQDELEWLKAVDAYKREHFRPFPSLTELLQIARDLGYRKEVARAAS